MKKLLHHLSNHPKINLAFALAYYLAVTLPHEQVGLLTVPVREAMGWPRYNLLLLGISVLGLLGYLVFFGKNLRQNVGNQRRLWGYLAATVLLSAAAMRWLVIINIEAVHFVQYAVLAVLLFPLVRRFGETLGWITLLGALDEAYQYFYIAPQRTNYFDFNDVVLNLLGGAFGLLLVASLGRVLEPLPNRKFYQSPLFAVAVILAAGLALAFAAGGLHLYPPEGGDALWAIIREPQVGLWTTVHPNFTFHVVQPLEGVVMVTLLLLFYGRLGIQAQNQGSSSNSISPD